MPLRFEHLVLFITRACNIACDICFLGDGPNGESAMSEADAIRVIEEARECADVTGLAISGGEPFLVYERLLRIAAHAKSRGLTVSVSTSGYWAQSPRKACRTLAELKNAGLDKLSLSADHFHQRYVPIQRVRNAILAAQQTNVAVGIVCVATKSHRLSEVLGQLGTLALDHYILETPVVPIGRAAERIDPSELLYTTEGSGACRLNMATLTVLPNLAVFPCCAIGGFTAPLRMGDAAAERLPAILGRAKRNPVLTVLAQKGPRLLYDGLREKGACPLPPGPFVNDCHLCYELMSSQQCLKGISEIIDEQQVAFLKQVLTNLRSGRFA